MSGAFGWQKNNTPGGDTHAAPGYFDQQSPRAVPPAPSTVIPSVVAPSVTVKRVGQTRAPTPISTSVPVAVRSTTIDAVAASHTLAVPNGLHREKTTGEVVVIISLDVTGSMSKWPEEIFKRLAKLYQVACDYFGTEEVDVLFIAHGDARTDRHPIQVGRVKRGQALELELASFDRPQGGGGQQTESHEIVAIYLRDCLDTSSARQVYTFFVTDEAACDAVDPRLVDETLGIDVRRRELDTKKVFAELAKRMSVYAVFCSTNCYGGSATERMRAFWRAVVGPECTLPLDDARRVVETMLGVFAKTTGQMDRFTRDLTGWHAGARHGRQNVKTVLASIALVGGNLPQSPKTLLPKGQTRPLLPPLKGGGEPK